MKHITSRDNSLFKQLRKLAGSARERRKGGQVLLDGAHLVEAYAAACGQPELLIVAEGDCSPDAMHMLQRMAQVETIMLPPAMLAEISPVTTPTGLLALAAMPHLALPAAPAFALLIEDIQDPGNLGSMLRSAAAAGVETVYLSAGCADIWSPKALRGGQGAHFILPVAERADLVDVAKSWGGRTRAPAHCGTNFF